MELQNLKQLCLGVLENQNSINNKGDGYVNALGFYSGN